MAANTAKRPLVVKTINKRGETRHYVYENIKGCSISSYMYERLKQNRRKKRQERGKLLFCEIPMHDILEIQKKHKQGVSIANIAKAHQLSKYFVCKAIDQASECEKNTLCSLPASA